MVYTVGLEEAIGRVTPGKREYKLIRIGRTARINEQDA